MREQCPDCGKWSNDLPHHLASTCKERVKVRTPIKRTGISKTAKPHTNSWYRKQVIEHFMKPWRGQPCAICGISSRTAGHHIVGRRRCPSLIIEPRNIVVLCVQCHMFSNEMAAHSKNSFAVVRFVQWLMENRKKQYDWVKANENIERKIRWKQEWEELQ